MNDANEPILTDLKKLLRRLEKIDPEARMRAQPSSFEPTATNALKLQKAVHDEVKTGYAAGDGLLQLQTHRKDQLSDPDRSAELPVIVKQSLPVASEPERESGVLRIVIIASVTAAIVSALATGFTVYWLNGGANNLGLLAQTQFAVRQPQAPEKLPVKSAERPADRSLPADETANASATGSLETSGEPQALAPQPAEPAAKLIDHSLPATETADATETSAVETKSQTPAGVLEGLLPEAASGPATAVSGLAPQEPRLAAGPETSKQTPAALGRPPRAPATRFTDAAASAPTIGSVTILSAATELAATLSATRAVASENVASAGLPAAPTNEGLNAAAAINPAGGSDIVTEGDTSATAAPAAQVAPVVAVYDAPENALQPDRDLGPATGDEPGQLGAAPDTEPAAAEPVPTEQLPASPDNVALVHPEEAVVAGDEAVDFPLKVAGSDQELAGHYLIISGLKRGARISSGIELMFDTWRIDIAQLSGLQLVVPAGFARRQHVDIELRRADGATREKSKLVIVTPGAASIVADDADDAVDLPAQVRRTVDQGEVQIDNGSVQGARILFERAAGKGSARAALLLAGSYDPRVIAAYKTATPASADIGKARRWYQRAIELGATRASQSLESLPQAGE